MDDTPRPRRIALLGGKGSFSHDAARRFFGNDDHELMDTFEDVVDAVKHRDCDCALVPIENSNRGTIVRSQLAICAQASFVYVRELLAFPVRHCLYSRSALANIREVRSFEPVFAQADLWLAEHLPHAIRNFSFKSSADAVQSLLGDDAESLAAIGSESAAEYGVPCIASNIQTEPNVTVFCRLDREPGATEERRHVLLGLRGATVEDVPLLLDILRRGGARISSQWELNEYPHRISMFELSGAFSASPVGGAAAAALSCLKNSFLLGCYDGNSITEIISIKHRLP